MFEDLRASTLDVALFQFWFVLRRLYIAGILTFLAEWAVVHVPSFLFLSTVQLIYLLRAQPYSKIENFWIEFFNEGCILLCAIFVLDIMNPKNSIEQNHTIGWSLIYVLSANVGGNLIIVAYQTSSDLF